MHLFLYIQIKPAQEIHFGNPFSKLVNDDEILFLDADNHSDEIVINHQVQSIKEANQITLVLDVSPDETIGKTVRLLERLLRQKRIPLQVLLHGQHQLIEKMLQLAKANLTRATHEQELQELAVQLLTR